MPAANCCGRQPKCAATIEKREFQMPAGPQPRAQALIPANNDARWFKRAFTSITADGLAEITVIDDASEPSGRDGALLWAHITGSLPASSAHAE
jgi:hypothetical protein